MVRIRSFIFTFITLISVNTAFADFWVDKVSVTEAPGASIVCTSSDSYSGHAYSIESIPTDRNGHFQFTVNNCYGMIGITDNPQGGGYEEIDYAFQLWASNTLNIMENGVTKWQGTSGSWIKGDILKIEKVDNNIRYYKNGSLLYTSDIVTSDTLYADFAFGGIGTGFDAPVLVVKPVVETPLGFWTEKVAVIESSNGSIVCTSNIDYAAHAYSVDSIPAGRDGYFQFMVNNCYGMVGLSSNPRGGGYERIDHAFQLWASSTTNIMENGVTKWWGNTGSWAKGDTLRIEKTGTAIKYIKNGNLLFTSTFTSSRTLYADFAFGGTNTGFDAPVLSLAPVVEPPLGFWTEKVSVTESSNGSITGTSDVDHAGHAYSIRSIPVDSNGYFQFTVNNCYGMVGLTSDPIGGGYDEIDYAFQLGANNTINIMENGITKKVGDPGGWNKGDKLKIEKKGTAIKYLKNDILLYTSKVPPSSALYADFAFGGANTGFDSPVLYVNVSGISPEPDSTIKVFNFVTANGDGKNDYFLIENLLQGQKHELFIFDRHNNVVFHTKNYQNDWNGKDLEAGTYFYKFSYDEIEETNAIFLSK